MESLQLRCSKIGHKNVITMLLFQHYVSVLFSSDNDENVIRTPGLRPANDRRLYFVTTFIIGWVQDKNRFCIIKCTVLFHPPETAWQPMVDVSRLILENQIPAFSVKCWILSAVLWRNWVGILMVRNRVHELSVPIQRKMTTGIYVAGVHATDRIDDDASARKRFSRYWPLVRGNPPITGPCWTNSGDAHHDLIWGAMTLM